MASLGFKFGVFVFLSLTISLIAFSPTFFKSVDNIGKDELTILDQEIESKEAWKQSNSIFRYDRMSTRLVGLSSFPKNGEEDEGCVDVASREDPCEFVKQNCTQGAGFVDYLRLHFCYAKDYQWASWIFIILWALLLFSFFAELAVDFFVNNLNVIVDVLKLSEDVAGVTFLALGNGAPDLFSAFSATNSSTPTLAISLVLGAALFVVTCVIGTLYLFRSFDVARLPYLRDSISYFMGAGLLMLFLLDGQVTIGRSIFQTSLYFVYVFVVFIISMWPKWFPQNQLYEGLNRGSAYGTINQYLENDKFNLPALDTTGEKERKEDYTFLKAILPFPFRWNEFVEMDVTSKFFAILNSLAFLLYSLTIPVVENEDGKTMYNRYLLFVQILLGISIIPFFLGFWNQSLYGDFQIWMLFLAIALTLALIVFFSTKTEEPPGFYRVFCLLGFVNAAVWLFIMADELVGLLISLGRILNISQDIIGLTILSWGNSVGDVVCNLTVAKQGMSNMALSASFAEPIFNVFFGLGLSLIVQTAVKPVNLELGTLLAITGLTLESVLIYGIIALFILRWKTTRYYGFSLFFIYLSFLVAIVVVEFT